MVVQCITNRYHHCYLSQRRYDRAKYLTKVDGRVSGCDCIRHRHGRNRLAQALHAVWQRHVRRAISDVAVLNSKHVQQLSDIRTVHRTLRSMRAGVSQGMRCGTQTKI